MAIPESHQKAIIHDVINFLGENPAVRRQLGLPEEWEGVWQQTLTPEQKFDCYLKWNGIIGHTADILMAVEVFNPQSPIDNIHPPNGGTHRKPVQSMSIYHHLGLLANYCQDQAERDNVIVRKNAYAVLWREFKRLRGSRAINTLLNFGGE